MIRETELISLKDGKTKSLTEFVQDLAPTPEPMDLTPTTPVDTGGADPVALSSYIDGIADTSASAAITAGLASGGDINNAILNAPAKMKGWTFVKTLSTMGDSTDNISLDSFEDLLFIIDTDVEWSSPMLFPKVAIAGQTYDTEVYAAVYNQTNTIQVAWIKKPTNGNIKVERGGLGYNFSVHVYKR